jgi:ArsR family transcriptional regulator
LWQVVREQLKHSPPASDDDRRLKQVLAHRRTRSEAFFSSAAGKWDRLREDLFGSTSHFHAVAALLDPDLVVGDLGCGTGRVSEFLAPFVRRIIAVDASRKMLDAARSQLEFQQNVELRHGPLEKLPIDEGELDVALMMLVLHYLPEPLRALQEAARSLRMGGRLVILDMLPHEREDYRQTMGHVWLGISEKQLTQWLRSAGFGDVRWRSLPPESKAKGPSLFVATARRVDLDLNTKE